MNHESIVVDGSCNTRGCGAAGASAAAVARAVQWVRNNQVPGGGIAVHHRTKDVTQEVTGYLIPTLMDVGEEELAITLARWEASGTAAGWFPGRS